MANTRLNQWKKSRRLKAGFVGGTEKQMERLMMLKEKAPLDGDDGDREGITSTDMIGACRELIYNVQDGKPIFHAIMYSINAERIEIEIGHVFDIIESPDESREEVEQSIRNTLAIATMLEIPVYPNTQKLATELANHHLEMLMHGFTAPDGKGNRIRLKLTRRPGAELISPDYLEKLDSTTTYFPAEIELIRQNLRDELRRRDNAGRILAALGLAISDLEELLDSKIRNEAKLQKCLTENPILFGTDYVRTIPKHKLGSEFEMDFALEITSGHVDLVEIESSNLKLFTKAGNPTSYLVHAEQQVFDWLAWIERNSAYARENLPGLISPIGFVIIGALASLTAEGITKLKKRNAIFRGQVKILTYEDLLDRAQNLLNHLQGLGGDKEESF